MNFNEIKVVNLKNKKQLRTWFINNHKTNNDLWIPIKAGKPNNINLSYLDAIEEALCFGWIDSINKSHPKYGHIVRFTPRRKTTHWTELNKERCRRLIKLKKMTRYGMEVLPDLNKEFTIPRCLKNILDKNAQLAHNFYNFPKLYQTIRIDSIYRYKKIDKKLYKKSLANFIKQTLNNKMYGQWNDYGRLLEK